MSTQLFSPGSYVKHKELDYGIGIVVACYTINHPHVCVHWLKLPKDDINNTFYYSGWLEAVDDEEVALYMLGVL